MLLQVDEIIFFTAKVDHAILEMIGEFVSDTAVTTQI